MDDNLDDITIFVYFNSVIEKFHCSFVYIVNKNATKIFDVFLQVTTLSIRNNTELQQRQATENMNKLADAPKNWLLLKFSLPNPKDPKNEVHSVRPVYTSMHKVTTPRIRITSLDRRSPLGSCSVEFD